MLHEITAEMRGCIDNCVECARSCRETLAHCLAKGGEHAEASHIRLLIDCAEFCDLGASLMLRGSEFHADLCRVCADVCKACEESCEEFSGDATMKACEDACRRCSESCRAMGKGKRADQERGQTGLHA